MYGGLQLEEAAGKFAAIWRTGDASVADDIMTPDVHDVDMMYGHELRGLQAFKDIITGIFDEVGL